MSEELKAFYQEMQEWIDAGLPMDNRYRFSIWYGLCHNLEAFLRCYPKPQETYIEEMREQFIQAGLGEDYPFDKAWEYAADVEEGTLYTNQERLNWIKQHAETGVQSETRD